MLKSIQKVLLVCLLLCGSLSIYAQEDCNKLGAWLWFIEITGYDSHEELADKLSSVGANRIYVKVADGGIDSSTWPELVDENLIQAYQAKGLEVWGWSYNYPGNEINQAKALYRAAQNGYEGFVVDVEMEFDGNPNAISALFEAFSNERQRAIDDGIVVDTFNLYVTTWGNPMDHNFPISSMDPYVTGYMPQTYVEQWGQSFVDNLEYWIDVGNEEYANLGATKGIHHIIAAENGDITPQNVNDFFRASGRESSLWRIPGGGVSLDIWNMWEQVNWDMDFCETTSTKDNQESFNLNLFPNPSREYVYLKHPIRGIENMYWVDFLGVQYPAQVNQQNQILIPQTQSTVLTLVIETKNKRHQKKVVILE